jgi:hypothetical protein
LDEKKESMKKKTYYSTTILWCGYLVFGWAVLGVIADSIFRSRSLYPFSLGIVVGLGAHMIIGVIAVLTAKCLMVIEGRVDRLEKENSD